MYIDGTFLKKGILIRPVYRKYRALYRMLYHMRYRIIFYDILYDIVYDIVCFLVSATVLAVGCLKHNRSVLSKSYAWRPYALLLILKRSACAETDEEHNRHRRCQEHCP
jgi:hypothetical protein